MAYVNAEMTKAVRNALKAKFPGVKFSVKKSHGSIDIVILESYTDLSEDLKNDYNMPYVSINHYYLDRYKYGEWYQEIIDAMKQATASVGHPYFDESDVQTDYFHTAYYYNLHIGCYGKTWKMKEEKPA